MDYKLSDFGLNKQSLKRKLSEINDKTLRDNVENILNMRTITYPIETIEFVINSLYNIKKDSDKPLSIYYYDFNKEKYNKLKSLIEIKKNGSIQLKKDIKNLVRTSNFEIISEEEYIKSINYIAEKYGIISNEIYKIIYTVENEWLNNISA